MLIGGAARRKKSKGTFVERDGDGVGHLLMGRRGAHSGEEQLFYNIGTDHPAWGADPGAARIKTLKKVSLVSFQSSLFPLTHCKQPL